MAAVMQINSNYVRSVAPYWMGETGKIKPSPPAVVRKNGQGNDVVAGYASFTWTWEVLLLDDYLWWINIMLGQPSFLFNQAKLYNYQGSLVTYSNAVLHTPTFDGFDGDTVLNVSVVIDQLF